MAIIFLAFSICSLTTPVVAAGDKENNSWEFRIAPYAWLSGLEGQIGSIPGLPPADVDVDFYDDVLGNINGAFMLLAEAKKGRFGITSDIVYTDIESDAAIPGENFNKITSRTKNWLVSAAGFYRVMETEQFFIDGLAGIRFWSVDSELALRGSAGTSISTDNKEEWFDPLVGVKGLTMIGRSKFFVNGAALLGGFGVSSDFMWDVNVNFGYQWSKAVATTIGYRYLDIDYEDDGFIYDVAQDGIIVGLSWRF